MGFRFRRSERMFQSCAISSRVCTSVGAPGTGISFGRSSNGDGRFLLGAAVLVAVSLLVLFLT